MEKNEKKYVAVKNANFQYSYYSKEAHGIAVETYKENGELKVAKVYIDEEIFVTVEEAFAYLQKLTASFTKETIVLYSFDLEKVWYCMYNFVEKGFSDMALYALKYEKEERYKVEFRSLEPWVENYAAAQKEIGCEANEAQTAAAYAQHLYDDMFVIEKKWWLTPYQRSKRLLQKCGSVEQTWPTWADYQNLRYKVYRGGCCFIHFPKLRKIGNYLALDRTSAYPAELLLNTYPMGTWQWGNEERWYEYHDVAFYGNFKITFEANYQYFYLLNVYGLNALEGYAELWLTDVDLCILQRYLNIKKIECTYLRICEKDFLPQYFTDFVYEAYCKKVLAKRSGKNDALTAQRKREVNAIYGNLIINTKNYDEYVKLSRATRPEWGIWCTCYERLALLQLVENVELPLYGDTDSVYATESDKTYAALYAYNRGINEQLLALCERNGYEYELLKELGTFKIEHRINDFCARKTKQYGFIDEDGKEHIKCSGYANGSVSYENLVNGKMPEIQVEMLTLNEGKVKVREMSYVQAKLFSEMAKEVV